MKRGGRGHAMAWCLGLLLALPGLAAAEVAPDSIASVKSAALELIQAQAQPADGPGALSLFVGNRDSALQLEEIRIIIDRAPQQRYRYSDREALALHQDGLHRFLLSRLEPGAHHLRADFAARYTEAPPDHWRSAGTLERDFTVGAQPVYLQLELVAGGYLGKPELQFHALRPAGEGAAGAEVFDVGGGADPRLRYAVFLTAAERPLAALRELYALRRQAGASLPADYASRLGEALAAFGLAQAPAASDDGPLAQAYVRYNQGMELMRQGREAEGAAELEPLASAKAGDEETAVLRDRANLVLGYAQLRHRTGANAVALFSRVRSPGPCSNAALLGLGWALLAPPGTGQEQEVGAAADAPAPLRRVPVLLQPQLTDDIAVLKRREPYRLRPASPQEEQALRRALVPWTELIGRDPLDAAVQEGMVAIPYALNHMGSYEEAREYFRRAQRVLEAADKALDQAMQRVRDGQMIQALDRPEAADRGWAWWLVAYPKEHWWLADDPRQPMAAPDTFYLQHLMADGAFRSAMQDFHDLRQLGEALNGAEGGSLRPRLDAAGAAQAARLQELALAELRREQAHTRMYLGEVRFALARANEPPPPRSGPEGKS
ncbi:MAG TPA: hypothetical protein VFA75_09390 [Nevskia sp.]|nr:hypothetical protein [Nevskia sp.]